MGTARRLHGYISVEFRFVEDRNKGAEGTTGVNESGRQKIAVRAKAASKRPWAPPSPKTGALAFISVLPRRINDE